MKPRIQPFTPWPRVIAAQIIGQLVQGQPGLHRRQLVHAGPFRHVAFIKSVMYGRAHHGHAMAAHEHNGLIAHQPRNAVPFFIAVHRLIAFIIINRAVIQQQVVVV